MRTALVFALAVAAGCADKSGDTGASAADCTSEEVPYDGIDNDCDENTPDDDLDGDGYLVAEDCDDTDWLTHPNAYEVCDGIDNDCVGGVDDGIGDLWYADTDDDGFGDPDTQTQSCTQPSGTVEDGSDCDDTDTNVNPNAPELCDGIDNDCDTDIDEDCIVGGDHPGT